MAIQKKAFDKLSDADQAIVREVMEATYDKFDAVNLVDNRGARDALLNAGIETVDFDAAEVDRIRAALAESNRELGAEGRFSIESYEKMLTYITEYRERQAAADSEDQGDANVAVQQ
jgi:TRAP-type C4-dicarboxylate transport system substrate-binding protein